MRKNKFMTATRLSLSAAFCFLGLSGLAHASHLPRVNFGQRLEPVGDKVIHGAGQTGQVFDAFAAYTTVVPNTPPAVYMDYRSIRHIRGEQGIDFRAQLERISSNLIIPQIGFNLKNVKRVAVDAQVAAGGYDSQISELVHFLINLGRPAYIRIGYEFNGNWNGYRPATYIAAFRRITNAIRAAGLNEVAIVWDISLDGDRNYLQWYPGDAYVDWWGVDIYSSSDFTNSTGEQFLSDALAHRKPVMIGESTPRYVGVLGGQTSWNNWFVGYFDYIRNHAVIKSFNYINWNWAPFPQWANWGDAQLQDNSVVAANYSSAVKDPVFLNRQPAVSLRAALGLSTDSTPTPKGKPHPAR
jgi:hypothetical protein